VNGRLCIQLKNLQENIRTLDKNQWYTRVHVKAIGTVQVGDLTKQKLDLVIRDLMADLKQKKNLQMEKTFTFGQKH